MKRSITLLLALFSALATLAWNGKDAEVKSARHTVKVSESDIINIQAKNTFVEIESWSKNEVEIFAQITFDGKETDRTRKFLDGFEKEVLSKIVKSGGELLIDTQLETPNKVQIGTRNSGVIISYGDNEMRIEYTIKVPSRNFTKVKSAYKDLVMKGSYESVEVVQYSADFRAGELKKATLNLKYGKAQINVLNEGKIESYENDTQIKTANSLDINDKYSDYKFGTIDKLNIVGYESDLEIVKCETLKGNLKYGNLKVTEKIGYASLTLYEFDISGEAFGNIRLENSKYSKINLDRAHEIVFVESYEDELDIRYLNILVTKSKYGDYTIGQLGNKLELLGYEDDVVINEVLRECQQIKIDGKYLTMSANMSGNPYSLNANVKYGKISYNEAGLDVRKYIKENDNLTIEAQTKQGKGIPIHVSGYEIQAKIN